MTDEQLPRIVLEPTQDSIQPTSQSVPLQSVPQKGSAVGVAATTDLKKQQLDLQQQLEAINQEEASLLSNVKEWVTKIQGNETKQQALERELLDINNQLSAIEQVPAGPSKAELEKQLREAEGSLKTLLMQQKIEEKKIFDNYAAGGMKREELLTAMDVINVQFDQPIAQAKSSISQLQQQLSGEPTPASPVENVVPEASVTTPEAAPDTTSTPAAAQSPIIQALSSLGGALSPEQQQALQTNPATIVRSKDGNGIVVTGVHFFDADLIRAGLGAEDIINLPTE